MRVGVWITGLSRPQNRLPPDLAAEPDGTDRRQLLPDQQQDRHPGEKLARSATQQDSLSGEKLVCATAACCKNAYNV